MSEQVIQPGGSVRMPTRGELVEQSLARFQTIKVRSGVLDALSQPDLVDVGVWLVEPGASVVSAWKRLHVSLGGAMDLNEDPIDPAIAQRTFYRYAERFLDIYSQVEAEHRRRITRLRVSDATDGDTRDMTRLGRNRFVELVTEALVTSDHIAELGPDLSKIAAVLADTERALHNADKLDLDRQNLEHRAAKAEAEIGKIKQSIQTERDQIKERLKSLQTKINELSKASERGQAIPQSIFDEIRSELTNMSGEVAA